MIRYFATNRSIADLEASTDRRSERLQLQTGGYYFVDMERYMAFYLGEVEPSVMPKSAIVKNSDADIFSSFLTKKEIESIVVCVHGFNVELFEAFTWFRILTETMRNASPNGSRVVTHPADIAADGRQAPLTAFIGFSWPSNGDVFSYMSDQREAVGSAAAFASLLSRLRSTGKSVKLLCHSMGNYLACNALKMLINKESSPPHLATNGLSKLMDRIDRRKDDGTHDAERLVDTFVMIAPDVERRHVVKAAGHDAETNYVGPFYSGLEHLVGNSEIPSCVLLSLYFNKLIFITFDKVCLSTTPHQTPHNGLPEEDQRRVIIRLIFRRECKASLLGSSSSFRTRERRPMMTSKNIHRAEDEDRRLYRQFVRRGLACQASVALANATLGVLVSASLAVHRSGKDWPRHWAS